MSRPLRLSMNLLIKNEEDIIADNIKVHAQLGVDCFVVIDNGSTDNTRDILNELKKKHEMIIIDRPVADYQQSNWKTEMAFVSKKKLKADWSIANDADEFWLPETGSLKDDLGLFGSIIHYPRFNMQLDQRAFDKDYRYYQSNLEVKLPIDIKQGNIIDDDQMSIMLAKINGKVMVNNKGLIRVKGGNHRAWHCWGKLNSKVLNRVKVYHYPIRSVSHFEDHIRHREKLLASGVKKMGDHYRRWVRMYQEGSLEQEYERLMPSGAEINTLKKFGVLRENNKPREMIEKLLGNT